MFDRIAVTLDGSEYAERALVCSRDLAMLAGASMHLISVLVADEPTAPTDPGREERRHEHWLAYLGQKADELRAAGVVDVSTHVRSGGAARAIAEFAGEVHADLIVMSTQGLGADERYALGSVALKVLMTAPCPVLMVRINKPAPPRGEAEERWQEEGGANVG
jgi:nucleotide-binding universal stress UspA family protein